MRWTIPGPGRTALAAAILAVQPLSGQQDRPVPAAAEQVSFDTSRPPQGTVRDPAGQPIAGATVAFRVATGMRESMYWRDSILRRMPLPQVRTGRDGEFFLPLTAEHRLFSPGNAGRLHLVVSKPGYHSWIEPLTTGLRGYLGSEVVLRPVRPADLFTVRVAEPTPGMWLRVHRSGGNQDEDRWLPVPADGTVQVPVTFVPTPVALESTANLSVPIAIEVQLLFPGRSTTPQPLRYGQRELVLARDGAAPGRIREVCRLQAPGGAAPVEPRGLYRCPDGRSRWFPVDPAKVVESEHLPLLALTAKDCLAVEVRYLDPAQQVVEVAPVPTTDKRVLELRTDAGRAVNSAQAWFFDLRHLPAHDQGQLLGWARPRRRLLVEQGRIDLSSVVLPGPGFLYVEARGLAPSVFVEPRRIVGNRQVQIGTRSVSGSVELTVSDDQGRPVPRAQVILGAAAGQLGAYQGRLPRTDATGRVTLEHLPPGSHTIRLTAPGHAEWSGLVAVRSQAPTRQAVTLYPATRIRVQLVDDDDRPVPFRSVRGYANFVNNAGQKVRAQVNTNVTVMSDSRGRILFQEFPAGSTPRLTDALSALVAGGNMQLTEDSDVQKLHVTPLATVLMPLPDATVVRESLLMTGRTSNRTLVGRPGCGAMVVRFPLGQAESTLSVYLQGSPPVRLTDDIVTAARATQGPGLLVVDQRAEVRRVGIRLLNLGDADPTLLRIELPGMNFLRNQPYLYGNSGLRLRKVGDLFELGLRDHAPVVAKVLHPRFLLTEVEIPGKPKPAATPVEVALTPGTPVEFRIDSNTDLQPDWLFNLYVHTQNNQMVLYQREKLAESNLRKVAPGRWELRLPFALEPGRYYFSLRIYNVPVNMSRRQFTVPADGPLVIDVARGRAVDDGAGTAPAPAPRPDLQTLQQRVDKLKRSAEALRKIGATDAKSRARLLKVLQDLEQKLATQEQELRKLRAAEQATQPPGKDKQPPPLPVRIRRRDPIPEATVRPVRNRVPMPAPR